MSGSADGRDLDAASRAYLDVVVRDAIADGLARGARPRSRRHPPGGRGRGHHARALFLRDRDQQARFDQPLAARIAERGIFVCPTINVNAPYVAGLTGIAIGEHLKIMHDLGVRIIAGTDAGVDPTRTISSPGRWHTSCRWASARPR